MSASEQVARQYTQAGLNKKQWGSIGYNAIVEDVIEGGVVDTTVQLQALVNKANTEGKRTIFLPHITNGQYYVTALTGADQVDFVGDNSSFVGGFSGTIGNLGGFAALMAETVTGIFNVMAYGAKGDGSDDTPGINAAITAMGGKAGTLFFPRPPVEYRVSEPINASIRGMKVVGDNFDKVYLRELTTGIDMIRISNSLVEVSGINFRPANASTVCIRDYSGQSLISKNRFLAAADGQGKAIILTDTNPDDSSFVAGAYTHTIELNHFGANGYSFEHNIYTEGTSGGQNATVINRNTFFGNRCVRIHAGGGNVISHNLMQSATGTQATPVGTAIDCDSNNGDLIFGNYIERFQYGTLMRAGAAKIASIYNHYDQNTNNFYSLSSSDYVHINADANFRDEFGWKTASSATEQIVQNAGVTIHRLGQNYVQNLQNVESYTNISIPADATAIAPSTSFHRLNGNGAARANCTLSTTGAKDGQRVTFFGLTWGVTIIPSTTVQFAGAAASVTFGNTTGNVLVMELIYSATQGKWLEVSRSLV